MKSKFSECPDFSCSRSDGTLGPVTSSFPAAEASLSELIPSQVQLFSQLDLFNVRFPQVEFRAEKPVVTFVIFSEIREVTGPELTEIESKFYQYASCKPGRI